MRTNWESLLIDHSASQTLPAERDLVIVRFDSPGEDFAIETGMIAYGEEGMKEWVKVRD